MNLNGIKGQITPLRYIRGKLTKITQIFSNSAKWSKMTGQPILQNSQKPGFPWLRAKPLRAGLSARKLPPIRYIRIKIIKITHAEQKGLKILSKRDCLTIFFTYFFLVKPQTHFSSLVVRPPMKKMFTGDTCTNEENVHWSDTTIPLVTRTPMKKPTNPHKLYVFAVLLIIVWHYDLKYKIFLTVIFTRKKIYLIMFFEQLTLQKLFF